MSTFSFMIRYNLIKDEDWQKLQRMFIIQKQALPLCAHFFPQSNLELYWFWPNKKMKLC